VGRLFSNTRETSVNTETVVLISPRVIDSHDGEWNIGHVEDTALFEQGAQRGAQRLDSELDRYFPPPGGEVPAPAPDGGGQP
jgi:type II secretory pathway component GspD/PulD (secretin)